MKKLTALLIIVVFACVTDESVHADEPLKIRWVFTVAMGEPLQFFDYSKEITKKLPIIMPIGSGWVCARSPVGFMLGDYAGEFNCYLVHDTTRVSSASVYVVCSSTQREAKESRMIVSSGTHTMVTFKVECSSK